MHSLKTKMYSKLYYLKNRERIGLMNEKYHQNHSEQIKARMVKYNFRNKEIMSLYKKNYRKKNLISSTLRSRMRLAMKNKQKNGSAVKDLGCTITEFKKYIESRFRKGMTWNNWSINGWHLDHIVPLSFFNLSDRKQFLKACHYTNLQPLWSQENFLKSNKIKSAFNPHKM